MTDDTLTRAQLTDIVEAFDNYPGVRLDESVLADDHYNGPELTRVLEPFRTLPGCERVARSAMAYADLCAEQAGEIERLRAEVAAWRLVVESTREWSATIEDRIAEAAYQRMAERARARELRPVQLAGWIDTDDEEPTP